VNKLTYITERNQAKMTMDSAAAKGVSLAIFCTGSFWNVEAILRAADRYAREYHIKNIPVVVAMTANYDYMKQTHRVTRSRDSKVGLVAALEYCKLLCDGPYAPYPNVAVLPHLDHADPVADRWEMTEAVKYLASVMFDAQKYTYEENVRLTSEYVRQYGSRILIEGIVEGLSVSGEHEARQNEDYIERAVDFVRRTGIDYLVADLGTEQQSEGTQAKYLKDRAVRLTESLEKSMLVLHGTSSLKNSDINGLNGDGVVRVNMWTRIVRESGQYAAKNLVERYEKICANDFESCEARQYIDDNIDEAARIMYEVMGLLNYSALSQAE